MDLNVFFKVFSVFSRQWLRLQSGTGLELLRSQAFALQLNSPFSLNNEFSYHLFYCGKKHLGPIFPWSLEYQDNNWFQWILRGKNEIRLHRRNKWPILKYTMKFQNISLNFNFFICVSFFIAYPGKKRFQKAVLSVWRGGNNLGSILLPYATNFGGLGRSVCVCRHACVLPVCLLTNVLIFYWFH